MGLIKRAAAGIWRRIDPTDKGRVARIMKHPPEVREDEIVFTSSGDFTGNPKALFLYMIDHGYNEKYKITWLFEDPKNLFEFDIPNVSSGIIWNKKGIRKPAAQKAAMRAKYLFYSHNMNWVRKYSPGQTYIDLWHGCGYKGNMSSDKKKIHYDYVIVTGRRYIDVFKEHLKDPDGNILDLGYPRNEMLFSDRSGAGSLMEELRAEAGADKAVIWMPTFRKSTVARLDNDTLAGDTGLPVLYDDAALRRFDSVCRDNKVLVILKQHLLQQSYDAAFSGLTNIKIIDDGFLKKRDADLYELMGRTDALLTDYSSAAIDYMLLDRPIGYTMDDFDRYEETRGWCLDDVKRCMAGHHIVTEDELFGFIRDIASGEDPYAELRREVRSEVHTYEEGFSRRILEYFGI